MTLAEILGFGTPGFNPEAPAPAPATQPAGDTGTVLSADKLRALDGVAQAPARPSNAANSGISGRGPSNISSPVINANTVDPTFYAALAKLLAGVGK